MAKTILEKELEQIGESWESFCKLSKKLSEIGEQNNFSITINRVLKRGWLVYGLTNNGNQVFNDIGLGTLKKYFDDPNLMMNEFINKFNFNN